MTQMECNKALLAGRTLVNQYGTEVHLDKYGEQVRCNFKGKRPFRHAYKFSNPYYWYIKPNLWNKITLFLLSHTTWMR